MSYEQVGRHGGGGRGGGGRGGGGRGGGRGFGGRGRRGGWGYGGGYGGWPWNAYAYPYDPLYYDDPEPQYEPETVTDIDDQIDMLKARRAILKRRHGGRASGASDFADVGMISIGYVSLK